MNEDNDEFDAILASWKPDQPVTRHDIDTLIMAVDFIDKKIEQLKKTTTYHDKRFEEDMLTIHSLINSNDQYNIKNFRELIQKDNEKKQD